jgi:23S rRNA pseudouridine2605 synthase
MAKIAPMRLQKALSLCGFCSRRRAEELIAAGKVKVNGHPAQTGMSVDPSRDTVTVDGQQVPLHAPQEKLYLMLNKPRGYVTTLQDELERRCVNDLVQDVGARVYPVGRLDRNSEGLLLLTNDGEFANAMMHPRSHVSKCYRVTVRESVKDDQLSQLCSGVELDGQMTLPAQAEVLLREPGRSVLEIVITEGKNRQIRRMCEAVGLTVVRLKRTSEGGLRLGVLPPGSWRRLTAEEVRGLKTQCGLLSPTEPAPVREGAGRVRPGFGHGRPVSPEHPPRPRTDKPRRPASPKSASRRERPDNPRSRAGAPRAKKGGSHR